MHSQLCRVCLRKDAVNSLSDKDVDNIQYSTKIMRCVNINISEDDILPDKICSECVTELSVSYEFVLKCEASEKVLRSLNEQLSTYEDDLKVKKEVKEENDDTDADTDTGFSFDNDIEVLEANVEKKEIDEKPTKKGRREKIGPIPCTICGVMVNTPSAMKIHVRKHTGERPFKCEFCDKEFPAKGSLKRHIETFHARRERKFTCETCGNGFFRKCDIITHMRRHTGERPYVCTYCPKRFLQVASLIRHKRIHTGDKPYSCPICDKKFSDKTFVNRHLAVHSDEKKYSCHLCNKLLKSKTSLRTHVELHKNEKNIICNYCGLPTSTKGNLKVHIKRIHSDKSGECTICSKTFSDLEAHIRKHTGEKPFLCDMCNKAFVCKRSLANHVQFKHLNSGKYKCSIGDCTRTFPTGTMLEFHLLKYHTNHTPFICQHCSRGFFRSSDLTRHIKGSHTDMMPKNALKTIIH